MHEGEIRECSVQKRYSRIQWLLSIIGYRGTGPWGRIGISCHFGRTICHDDVISSPKANGKRQKKGDENASRDNFLDTYFCLYSQGTCSFTTDTHNYNLNTNHSVVVNCKIHWLCNELSILLVRAKHEEKGGLYSKRRNLSLKFPTRLEFLACWLCSSDSERKKARLSGKK